MQEEEEGRGGRLGEVMWSERGNYESLPGI